MIGYDFSGSKIATGYSASDRKPYGEVVDFRRAFLVAPPPTLYSMIQVGSLGYYDGFEATAPQWQAAANTVAQQTARAMRQDTFGATPGALKLTTAAATSSQAIARKFFLQGADQGTGPGTTMIGLEMWFQPQDANIQDLQMFYRVDDTVQRWEAAIRYCYAADAPGGGAGAFQHLNSAGNFVTDATWLFRAAAGNVGDAWHHFMMLLNYHNGLNGSGGYLTYGITKLDDSTNVFGTQPGSSSIGGSSALAHPIATGTLRESSCDLLVTSDNNTGTSLCIDEFVYANLSGCSALL